jgi:hypothetical protein
MNQPNWPSKRERDFTTPSTIEEGRIFRLTTKTRKTLFTTLITASGVIDDSYFRAVVY